jgi:signal transduction histidine kinase
VIAARLTTRPRLTAAFAAALLVVLAFAALFVYLRVRDDLNAAIDDGLRSRADDVAALAAGSGERPPDLGGERLVEGDEGFSQILGPTGGVLASTLAPGTGPAIDGAQIERAARTPVLLDREVPGVEGGARILARPAGAAAAEAIVVVGSSTEDRSEALGGLRSAFLVGAPVAVLLITGLGYVLAGLALAPVAAALERERTFVADASHELRTPLANLRAELELAGRRERSVEELRAAVVSAAEETDRLSQLAEDLLVIARSDRDRLAISPEPIEPRTLLERVRKRFAARARRAGREIVVDPGPDGPVLLDVIRVEQALANLVDNALRHGDGEIRVSAERNGDGAAFEVSDGGPGFPAGFAPRAFERFTRADQGRTGDGAGLGLAIAKAIAEAHGGDASIASDRGPRTTVRISF